MSQTLTLQRVPATHAGRWRILAPGISRDLEEQRWSSRAKGDMSIRATPRGWRRFSVVLGSCLPAALVKSARRRGFWSAVRLQSQDPGRLEMRSEYCQAGSELLRLPLSSGSELVVKGYQASEQRLPPNADPSTWRQEWRSLTFEPPGPTIAFAPRFIQAVTKVTIQLQGEALPERKRQSCAMDARVLALGYPKTLASAIMTGLAAMGISTDLGPRVLLIGLGGGSLPVWLADAAPSSSIDVVELESAVLQAARDAMGMQPRNNIRIFIEDGADFAARRIKEDGFSGYHAVIVDAYDEWNEVPSVFTEAGGHGVV